MTTTLRTVAATTATALLGLGLFTACGVDDTKPVSAEKKQVIELAYIATMDTSEVLKEPANYTLAAADANESLTDLVWTDWGTSEASATGTYVANDCEPSCAEGTMVSTPVKVTADKLYLGEASARYGRLTITATGSDPEDVGTKRFDIPTLR